MDYDTLENFRKVVLSDEECLIRFDMWLNDPTQISLNMIEVDPNCRNSGVGTRALKRLCNLADLFECQIVLTPEHYDRHGNRNERGDARLTRWYRRFGFVSNKGRNADYEIWDSMYRNPK